MGFLWSTIIEYPYIVTLAKTYFGEFFLIHIFSMTDAGCELVEEFHDIFLSETEIFSSPCVCVVTVFIALFEHAPIESMCYFSCFAELSCVFLCNSIEYFGLFE